MDLTRLFLESPWRLGALGVAVQFGLICLWSVRRTTGTRWAVRCGFAAGPLLLAVSILVTTPRERVMAECRMLARAVDDGDMARLSAGFDDRFEAAGMDRQEFISRLERVLSRARVDDVRLTGISVEIRAPDLAVAEFNASGRPRSEQAYYGWLTSRWRVTFRRSEERWRVTTLESVPVPPLNIRDLHGWLK
jgi:hypothetical protein